MARSRLPQSDTLADILERVLETGIVIAGDIRVNLNDVELLTIQIRLVVCSVDKAQEMGMDWWKDAGYLYSGSGRRLGEGEGGDETDSETARQLAALNERLAQMEKRIDRLAGEDGEATTGKAGNDTGEEPGGETGDDTGEAPA